MAGETGPATDPLTQLAALLERPHEFDYFEAMRRYRAQATAGHKNSRVIDRHGA